MGVEAARPRPAGAPRRRPPGPCGSPPPRPAYLDKTNATAVHAALRLSGRGPRPRLRRRAAVGGRAPCARALEPGRTGPTLVVMADQRDGLPGGRRRVGRRRRRRRRSWSATTAPARRSSPSYLGGASATDEFLDRWRAPGERRSKVWEERFGETRYVAPRASTPGHAPSRPPGSTADEVDHVVVTGMHARAAKALGRQARRPRPSVLADDLSATVGQTGTAHPGLVLASVLERPAPARSWPWSPSGRRGRRASCSAPPTPSPTWTPGPSGGRPRWRRAPTCPTGSS